MLSVGTDELGRDVLQNSFFLAGDGGNGCQEGTLQGLPLQLFELPIREG
jgi:hypothetical protein